MEVVPLVRSLRFPVVQAWVSGGGVAVLWGFSWVCVAALSLSILFQDGPYVLQFIEGLFTDEG